MRCHIARCQAAWRDTHISEPRWDGVGARKIDLIVLLNRSPTSICVFCIWVFWGGVFCSPLLGFYTPEAFGFPYLSPQTTTLNLAIFPLDPILPLFPSGQSYEVRMLDNRKPGELPELNNKMVKVRQAWGRSDRKPCFDVRHFTANRARVYFRRAQSGWCSMTAGCNIQSTSSWRAGSGIVLVTVSLTSVMGRGTRFFPFL